jgi:hypothetical protein
MCGIRRRQGAPDMTCHSSSCYHDVSCCEFVEEAHLSGCRPVAVILLAMYLTTSFGCFGHPSDICGPSSKMLGCLPHCHPRNTRPFWSSVTKCGYFFQDLALSSILGLLLDRAMSLSQDNQIAKSLTLVQPSNRLYFRSNWAKHVSQLADQK